MLIVAQSNSGRTDLVGVLGLGTTGFVWSPSAKAFVSNPSDAHIALAEFPPPLGPGLYRWVDMNVPAIPSSDEYLFQLYAVSGTAPNLVYTPIGEPVPNAPPMAPVAVMYAPLPLFFGR